MIGAKQGGEEGFIAREDLAGVELVYRLHYWSPGDQPVDAGAVRRAAAAGPGGLRTHVVSAGGGGRSYPCRRKVKVEGPALPDGGTAQGARRRVVPCPM